MRPSLHPFTDLTAGVLAGIGGLHMAWGRGSTVPFRTRFELNDVVIGRQATPSPPACYAVAAALSVAATSVALAGRGRGGFSRLSSAGVAMVLAIRAGAGFAGRTDALVPGSTSERFRRTDRRLFSPLCLGLAIGAVRAAATRRATLTH
jgi:hypothetical protein